MKRLFLIAVAVVALAVASKAEAALTYSLQVCQGITCVNFPASSSTGGDVAVGDYIVNASGGGLEGIPTSTQQLSTVNVRRVTDNSATALTVWLTVQGYTMPTGPAYEFDVSLGVTESSFGGDNSRHPVDFQAWYSATNATGFPTASPPAGSQPSLLASCTPAQVDTSDSCNSNPGPVIVGPGSTLFSITSLTTFHVPLGHRHLTGTTGQVTLTAVPEPGSLILLGTGLLGVAAIARRRMAGK